MPPPSTAQFRVMVQQFVSFTGQSERTASRWVKASGYRVNDAVDKFLHAQSGVCAVSSAVDGKLDALFNGLRDAKKDSENQMELESTMTYLTDKLGVNLENAELFVALDLIQAPTIGEVTRKGYIQGWKEANAGTSHREHATHLRRLVSELSFDTVLFKKVYKYAFVVGREKDQKALSLENAIVYWNMLFAAPGMEWKNEHRDWLPLWTSYLDEKWTRSVNKDMWNMIIEFALKSMQDDELGFWSEDGAWPSVIDDFVEWCKSTKGIGKPKPVMEGE